MGYIDNICDIFKEYSNSHHSEILLRADLEKLIENIKYASYIEGYNRGRDEAEDGDDY